MAALYQLSYVGASTNPSVIVRWSRHSITRSALSFLEDVFW
jgi:hypothetical protein